MRLGGKHLREAAWHMECVHVVLGHLQPSFNAQRPLQISK